MYVITVDSTEVIPIQMLPCVLRNIKRRSSYSYPAIFTVTLLLLFLLCQVKLYQIKHGGRTLLLEVEENMKELSFPRKQESQIKDTEDLKMRERRELKEKICHKFGLDVAGNDTLHQVKPWEYFINKEYKLVWCNIFKSASTSWMYIFNVLAGYDPKFLEKTKKVPLQLARDKYSRPSAEELVLMLKNEGVTSFIVGRNPLERLVSAYREKIYGALPRTLHDKLRRRITEDFRGVSVPKSRTLPEQFIPTFNEFVKFLIRESEKGKEPEMHWAPAFSFCNPCQVCKLYLSIKIVICYD